MGYRSLNNHVACSPFTKHGIQTKVTASGLLTAENYSKLTRLLILADGPDGIKAGQYALVSGRFSNQPWAKEVLETDDETKFILIPLNNISMVAE
jgi:hypothetical protein